jgi:hypothetical protein
VQPLKHIWDKVVNLLRKSLKRKAKLFKIFLQLQNADNKLEQEEKDLLFSLLQEVEAKKKKMDNKMKGFPKSSNYQMDHMRLYRILMKVF